MPPIYAPLVSSQSQIRTIILHSGQFNEDIQCSFHIVSLDGNLEYEALSYVWGDPTITQPVIVDGNEMQVTTNLEAALRHLRSDQKPRTLWVDAICINQQDDREKSAQVPMMGKIFQQATSVLAWFGHGDEDIIIGISWFQHYILKQTNEHTVNWSALEAEASIVEDARDIKLPIFSIACDGLLNPPRDADLRASNPRDRIYALHGLIPDISEKLPMDYSKPEKQVLLEAVAYMLGTFIAGLQARENGSTPQRLCHRFARCAVAHKQGHDQVSDNDLLDAFEAVSKDISLLTPEDGRFVSRAVELVISSGFNFLDKAACIITSRGCVGFAPIDTEDNDLVVFPREQHPMMVLRREFTDLSKSSQECYLMVGPAEVDAVTSSGYVVDSVVSKVKDYGIAEYLIH
ncbi:putative Heterokaryon incompatibility domain-containing protein [Seiridium cardinale]|uniref:Heterokaryon incompatibility domain-containing protein n=1 Tax=Seiridium cardinale TaxID=138064 RepID=A0ABR2Y4C8_9PEZI